MHSSNLTFLLIAGVAMVAFGGFVYWNESRRGNRSQVRAALIGFPGVYLWVCAEVEKLPTLAIVGVALVLAGGIAQLVVIKRSGGRLLPPFRWTRKASRGHEQPTERRYDEW